MKITMKRLSEYMMVAIACTVLFLGAFWVKGFFYLGTILTVASALALVLFFAPVISSKFNWNDRFTAVCAASEKLEAELKEEVGVSNEEPLDSDQPEEVQEEDYIATYENLLKLAEIATDEGDFEQAGALLEEAEGIEEKVAEAKAAKEAAAAKAKAEAEERAKAEANLRKRIADAHKKL